MAEGAEWIQIDEPALALDLPAEWVEAYKSVFAELSKVNGNYYLLLILVPSQNTLSY